MTELADEKRYLTLSEGIEGEIGNGTGFEAAKTMDEVVEDLAGGQDGGEVFEVIEVSWSDTGVPTAKVVTLEVGKKIAALIHEPEGGLSPDERPWVHPLAFAAGFEWTMTDHERADAKADYDRRLEQEE